jgi:tetratricopeptide (TPR) repeat protein
MVVVIHIICMATDAGFREFFLFAILNNYNQYIDRVENLDKSKIPFLDIAAHGRGLRLRLRTYLSCYIFFFIFVAFCKISVYLFSWSSIVMALLPAVYCAITPIFNRVMCLYQGVKKSQNSKKEKIIRAIGWLLSVMIAAPAFYFIFITSSFSFWQNILIAIACYAVLYLSAWIENVVFSIGRKYHEVPFGDSADDSCILYLRSFKDDKMKMYFPFVSEENLLSLTLFPRSTFEEVVSQGVFTFGELVAMGRPDEPIQRFGALKTYSSNEEWQALVQKTAAKSKMIICVAANTGAFEWEMKLVKSMGLQHKTVVLVPPINDESAFYRLFQALITFRTSDENDDYIGRLEDADFSLAMAPSFSIAENDEIKWGIYAGRDYGAYMLVLLLYGIIFPKILNDQNTGVRTNLPPISTKPKRIPARESITLIKNRKMLTFAENDNFLEAIIECEKLLSSEQGDIFTMLRFTYGKLLCCADRNNEALKEYLWLEEKCRSMDWVWTYSEITGIPFAQEAKLFRADILRDVIEICRKIDDIKGYNEAIGLLLGIGEDIFDKKIIAEAHYDFTLWYQKHEEAIEHATKAKKLYKELGNFEKVANCCEILSRVYERLEHYETALHYAQKAQGMYFQLEIVGDESDLDERVKVLAEKCLT